MTLPPVLLQDLKQAFEKVFIEALRPQMQKQSLSVKLDDALTECFSTLSPDCREEELEDLVYFILDLLQFHGAPIAAAEVDIDSVTMDLRMMLEVHAVKMKRAGVKEVEDNHLFLVLDRTVQTIPWESIPILRGRSVSRIPSVEFLVDRLQYASSQKTFDGRIRTDRAVVDPRKAYYVLNPSGDLQGTEGRFKDWLAKMRGVGWQGVVGKPPTEQQFSDALLKKDLVMWVHSLVLCSWLTLFARYFGHGGAEQYIRSHRLRNLPRCAATMLWGCSSGVLRNMGEFDPVGTPYDYMLAGW
jgi:separase